MKEEKDTLRDFMQGAFQDYEVAPDPQDWNRIEKTLSKRNKTRFISWMIWTSAACLLLLLALYTGGILNHSENTFVRIAVSEHKTVKTPSSVNIKSAVNKSNTNPSEKINQSKINTAAIRVNKIINKTKSTETKNTILTSTLSKQITPVDLNNKTITVSAVQTLISSNKDHNFIVHTLIPKSIELIVTQKKPYYYDFYDLKQWPVQNHLSGNIKEALANNSTTLKFNGLSLNNNSGLISQSSGKTAMSYSGAFASQLTSSMYNNSIKVFNNSFLVSSNIGNLLQNNSLNYFPPVTFGLNVNLSLQNNLSIETGIQYTRLQSSGSISITSSNAIQFTTNFGYHVDENLYYLGVPFILNYNIAQKRKTSYYISGGISLEKGLIAKYKATPEDNFPGMEPIYSHNAISGLQYSMNSGIGISYKFIRHFELFGQPSLTYYFNSDVKNNTVYSVHPLIFNLRTGIRYTIR